MTFELKPLPYPHDALAPTIDEQTMRLHHGKHHQAYVDNLNKAVAADESLGGKSIGALLSDIASLPKAVRNNGGGHWNHEFFWESMTPGGSEPTGPLVDAITAKWGSLDAFKAEFAQAGVGQFGSGWVWVIVGQDGELAITTTPNQDNPLMGDASTKGTPVIGNDLWEHAYYLTYNNRRPDYLNAWWAVLDWNKANARYEAARVGA